MSAALDILAQAKQLGVTFKVVDGGLRYSGSQAAVKSILPALRAHKAEILSELSGGPSGLPEPEPSKPTEPDPAHCPPDRRRFSPVAGKPWLSQCEACGACRCTMLTADANPVTGATHLESVGAL